MQEFKTLKELLEARDTEKGNNITRLFSRVFTILEIPKIGTRLYGIDKTYTFEDFVNKDVTVCVWKPDNSVFNIGRIWNKNNFKKEHEFRLTCLACNEDKVILLETESSCFFMGLYNKWVIENANANILGREVSFCGNSYGSDFLRIRDLYKEEPEQFWSDNISTNTLSSTSIQTSPMSWNSADISGAYGKTS